MNDDDGKMYVDASQPATLQNAGVSMDCPTLQEAVIAWYNLPANERLHSTIRGADGRTYAVHEIARLYHAQSGESGGGVGPSRLLPESIPGLPPRQSNAALFGAMGGPAEPPWPPTPSTFPFVQDNSSDVVISPARRNAALLDSGSANPSLPLQVAVSSQPEAGTATSHSTETTLTGQGGLTADAEVMSSEKRTAIGRALAANHAQIVLNIEAVLLFLEAKIAELDPQNTDEARAELAQYRQIKVELEKVRDTARAFAVGKIPEDAAVETSRSFAQYIHDWWDKDHVNICRIAFRAVVFGSCIGICQLSGADDLTVLVSGVIASGKQVVDGLKSAAELFGKKKTQT